MASAALCFVVSEGVISITLDKLIEEGGKALIAFGIKKLTSILSDGSDSNLDIILSKLDQLQAAIFRLSTQVYAAIAEGDLKQIDAEMKSRLLACKQKTADGTMTVDNAQELLETALHLQSVMSGTAGTGISGCYLETARKHCLSNTAGTNFFQFWETFTTMISYYGSLLMAAYGALVNFKDFHKKAGNALQTFLEQAAEFLGPIPQIMKNTYGPEGGKKSVIIRNRATGADLRVSGNNRWYLHQAGNGIWFRFANQENGTGIDHWYGREIRSGEPGAWHNNHMWTLIVVAVEGSNYYFNIRNDATGQCLDHFYGKIHNNGYPVLSTAGTPSWHINHQWRLEEWQ